MQCPILLPALIISDNAPLAARLSAFLARPGGYVAVVDAPRMARPDADAEITRRTNVAARIQPKLIVLAALETEAQIPLIEKLPRQRTISVASDADVDLVLQETRRPRQVLRWGPDNLGIGLLTALNSAADLEISDGPSPGHTYVPGKSSHLVVCESGNAIAEVIAANYAYSLSAGLKIIPQTDEADVDRILEAYYSIYSDADGPAEVLTKLRGEIHRLTGDILVPEGGSITFVTSGLPFGVAHPDAPSTHLLRYPDLGLAIANGFAAEQRGARGVQCAVLIDPGTTDAPEIAAAATILRERRVFVRGYIGPTATVREISHVVEHFPYDLMLISTHCGDASGYRWTYQYDDAEGRQRTLVVDISIGIATTNKPDMLSVTQKEHFRSLDGVHWNDPERDRKVTVGSAITEYIRLVREKGLEPVAKENIDRVVAGRALRMFDHNYIPIPHSLFPGRTPIIINNACVSWHHLAKEFIFSGASAYIGTLIEVTPFEASEVVTRLIRDYYSKPIAHALWAAQNRVYGASPRRPYVVCGVYPRRVRTMHGDVPAVITKDLEIQARAWRQLHRDALGRSDELIGQINEVAEYYERELAHFRSAYPIESRHRRRGARSAVASPRRR